jgi:hypothetical protein
MTSFAHASVFGMALAGKRPRPRLGRSDGKRAQARNGVWRLFSAAGADTPHLPTSPIPALHRETK